MMDTITNGKKEIKRSAYNILTTGRNRTHDILAKQKWNTDDITRNESTDRNFKPTEISRCRNIKKERVHICRLSFSSMKNQPKKYYVQVVSYWIWEEKKNWYDYRFAKKKKTYKGLGEKIIIITQRHTPLEERKPLIGSQYFM